MDALAKVCPKCGRRYDTGAAFCQTDGVRLQLTEEKADPYIGQTLLDQFKIEEKIGAGGMGTVYRARQTTLHRDVAIKILHAELADNRDAVRRFKREARVCTALDHPNVVRVFLFGQLKDGSLYIVMEYLRGRSLLEVLQQEGALPVSRALHIAAQICDGVGEAHHQGVVHRDLKPENVVLVQKSRDPDVVKVLDFGIARMLWGDDQTQATQSGLVFGTARYISPEGAAGESTDGRSDVYSLGTITYQLLAGQTPFDAPSPVAMLMKHIHSSPPHLTTHEQARHVPAAVADVVMRALSKNPEGRYSDAHELGEALRTAAATAGFDVHMHRAARSFGSISEPPIRGEVSSPAIHDAGSGSVRLREVSPTPHMRPAPQSIPQPPESQTLAGAPNPFGDDDDVVIPGLSGPPLPPRAKPLGRALGIAFLAGAVLVGGGYAVSEALEAPTEAPAPDADALLARAQIALAAGRLAAPSDDSVLGLTTEVLALRPSDPAALALRSQAADQLVTRARATTGDEARDLYRQALLLRAGDASIETALAALDAPPPPTVVPGVRTQPLQVIEGQDIELIAVLEANEMEPAPTEARFVIHRAGRSIGRSIPATLGDDGRTYRAPYTFARHGAHDVLFRFGRGPERIERRATIEVSRDPARPVRTEPDPPPVTTQGSVWTPTIVPAWTHANQGQTTSPLPPPPDPDPPPPPVQDPPPPWTGGGSVL
ncbi:MAG: protein kinase [Sandaracinaceae bacterium]